MRLPFFRAALAIAATAASLLPTLAQAESVVMPFRCEVAGGGIRMLPGPDRPHRILGRRESELFTACSPSDGSRCRNWMIHRFDVDCGGVRVPWLDVAAAASRRSGATVRAGRLTLDMGPGWSDGGGNGWRDRAWDRGGFSDRRGGWGDGGFRPRRWWYEGRGPRPGDDFDEEPGAYERGPRDSDSLVAFPPGFAPKLATLAQFTADGGRPEPGPVAEYGDPRSHAPGDTGGPAERGWYSSPQAPPAKAPAPIAKKETPAPVKPETKTAAKSETKAPPAKAETKPGEAKAAAPKSETRPAEPKTADTKTVETKDTKPHDTKAADAKAGDAKPAAKSETGPAPAVTVPGGVTATIINGAGADRAPTSTTTPPSTSSAPPAAPPSTAPPPPATTTVTANLADPSATQSASEPAAATPTDPIATGSLRETTTIAERLSDPAAIFGFGTFLVLLASTTVILARRRHGVIAAPVDRDFGAVSFAGEVPPRSALVPRAEPRTPAVRVEPHFGGAAPRSPSPEPAEPDALDDLLSPTSADESAPAVTLAMPATVEEALDVIGASPDAPLPVLKKIVDGLRQSWHPDLAQSEGDRVYRAERLAQINVAWDILSSEQRAA